MWTLGTLGGAFVVIVLPALLGRRLLGMAAGPLRVALAGIIGIAVSGSLIGPRLQNPDRGPLLLSLMVGVGLLAAMVALVGVRIAGRHGLTPYLRGRGRGGGPRELRQALQAGAYIVIPS
ncbi:hypothetical protein AB0436_27635 [Streptomyces sp. NPDC051322]|uniref:hypothetical protein n=1 Tax=Streptomyces sp. NPDC051322 TaxID=3154645 RepID=UPI0034508EED